jgi:hypothetical protein
VIELLLCSLSRKSATAAPTWLRHGGLGLKILDSTLVRADEAIE